MNKKIEEVYNLVNGIEYTRDIPEEAKQLAKENNIVVIVGGSDDLMYAYGTDCYLTDYEEHSYGWDGDTLEDISNEFLKNEAKQLGLKIYWCGKIIKGNYHLDDYDTEKQGAFSYTVNSNIEFKDFTVYEEKDQKDVYCTGIIIQLPKDFIVSKI